MILWSPHLLSIYQAYCPFGFADGLADYGQMMDLWVKTARAQLAYNKVNGSDWITEHLPAALRLSNYS
jgi:hypothetical protein